MPFPTEDQAWNDTLLYLLERRRPGERTLAPDEFADELPFVRAYSQHDAQEPPAYAWVVVHKGLTEALGAPFLHRLPDWSAPVFANDVFVVFAREPGFAMTDLSDSDHVKSLFAGLPPDAGARVPAPPPAAPAPVPQAKPEPVPQPKTAPVPQPKPAPAAQPKAAPTPPPKPAPAAQPKPAPVVAPATPKSAAPQPAKPDGSGRLRKQEVLRLLREHVGDHAGQSVLALGTGSAGLAASFTEAQVMAVEADAGAIAKASGAQAGLPNRRFLAADPAAPLAAPPFDATLLVDSLPEREDAAAALLAAAAAATRPGGLLFVSADNRDALGRRTPGGVSLATLTAWVRAAGFRPLRAEGVMLPWGGPVEDSLLDALRELGRLAGPAYAQGLVLVARRG